MAKSQSRATIAVGGVQDRASLRVDFSKENTAQFNRLREITSQEFSMMKGMPLEGDPSEPSTFTHPYQEYITMKDQGSTLLMPPRHPSVTPATDSSLSRKRQRVEEESPMTAYSYDYFSSQGIPYAPSTPQSIMPQLAKPSPSHFSQASSHPSGSHHRSPASAMIPEPYSSQSVGRNEPWVADINPQFSIPRSTIAPVTDFDPYNADILSDHEDHRDGSISPVAYPRRGSL